MAREFLEKKKVLLNQMLENTRSQTRLIADDDNEPLESLMAKRKEIMDQIDALEKLHLGFKKDPAKEDELKAILKMIISIDEGNQKLMRKELDKSRKELRKISDGRQRTKQYGNEYGIYKEEGVFFDTKE